MDWMDGGILMEEVSIVSAYHLPDYLDYSVETAVIHLVTVNLVDCSCLRGMLRYEDEQLLVLYILARG